jgi:hypothetical protein
VPLTRYDFIVTIKTEEIILKTGKAKQLSREPQTVCEIFCYQADNIEQMPLGNLFIVAELSCVKDCGHLNTLLASLIKREYYLFPAKGPALSFQAALKKANAHLKDSTKQESLEWLGKIHFIALCVANQELFFAQAGEPRSFLFRENRLTDLGRKIVPAAQKPHPSKIFSSIVSGKIESGDKIILATPAIQEIFSPAGLRQILAGEQNIAAISDQINKTLREQENIKQLAILLIQTENQDPPEQPAFLKEKKHKIVTPPIDLNEIFNNPKPKI